MIGRIVPLGLLLLGISTPIAGRAAEMVEKSWFFTTENTLTVDVRCAAGVQPDWPATVLRVAADQTNAESGAVLKPVRIEPATDNGVVRVVFETPNMKLWEPGKPVLYRATVEVSDKAGRRERVAQRLGFRSFTTKEGRLLLNGQPLFLRGLAINPPGRGIPEPVERSRRFAEDYVRYLLSLHVNIIRIPDDDTWYDVCDELGMMVFGGNYSGRVNGRGSDGDPAAAVRWFQEEKFHPITHHPALVIYALTNEVAGEGASGAKWDALLGKIHSQLQPWDPTRLYIANAGYGYGRVGEINDLHRYWGWYYETPFTFLHLRDYLRFPDKVQPLTFTECVGNYNGPGGRVNLTPNHKNPLAQLNWTGHAPAAEQGALEYAHQSFTTRQATELFRRLRPINTELSGVFPFTILFDRWHDIQSFADMLPKPAAAQLRASYQPILVSWEFYTSQVYAGAELKPIAHIVNDADDRKDLEAAALVYEVRDATERVVAGGKIEVPKVPYYGTARLPLTLRLPEALPTGTYALCGTLTRGGKTLSENRVDVYVAPPSYVRSAATPTATVRLLDPSGTTARALQHVGVAFTPFSVNDAARLPSSSDATLVLGEETAASLSPALVQSLRTWVEQGGHLLILRQPHTDAAALTALLPVRLRWPTSDIDNPAYPPPARPARNGFNVNPERPNHAVFAGIDRRQLRVWSDYSGWDEQRPGMPRIYPVTDGFVLANKGDSQSTAVLANYGPGLDAMAVAEFFTGNGSVILSGLDLASRAAIDPVAGRLLRNLVAYSAQRDGHERYELIEAPIVWGQYETERGILTGLVSGLMLNSRPALTGSYRDLPITITPEGHEFAGGAGGWNSRPGIVYVPFGRRPFGPYQHRNWSGVPEPANSKAKEGEAAADPDADTLPAQPEGTKVKEGEGRFWCRIRPGKTQAAHRVFNPAAMPLTVHITANGRTVDQVIGPGATERISVPLNGTDTSVDNVIRGDRRLVLLETAYE